jgi:mono/diheme cytochrome c family protein
MRDGLYSLSLEYLPRSVCLSSECFRSTRGSDVHQIGSNHQGRNAGAHTAGAAGYDKAKCAGCHGTDGKGKAAMKTQDLASPEVQKMSDADLSTIISNGKGKMPAYKTMTGDQVKDMVAYIRSFKK